LFVKTTYEGKEFGGGAITNPLIYDETKSSIETPILAMIDELQSKNLYHIENL